METTILETRKEILDAIEAIKSNKTLEVIECRSLSIAPYKDDFKKLLIDRFGTEDFHIKLSPGKWRCLSFRVRIRSYLKDDILSLDEKAYSIENIVIINEGLAIQLSQEDKEELQEAIAEKIQIQLTP